MLACIRFSFQIFQLYEIRRDRICQIPQGKRLNDRQAIQNVTMFCLRNKLAHNHKHFPN